MKNLEKVILELNIYNACRTNTDNNTRYALNLKLD